MNVWIAFVCGLILGGAGSVLVMGLRIVTNRSAGQLEQLFSDVVPPVKESRYTLRLFCSDDHEWFGECIPAVCPICHKPAIGARL